MARMEAEKMEKPEVRIGSGDGYKCRDERGRKYMVAVAVGKVRR